jgi:hypothetical protein
VWLHELGHCLGNLGHATPEGVLIMQPYVGYTLVSKYMTDQSLYLDELIDAIGNESAGLLQEEVDEEI